MTMGGAYPPELHPILHEAKSLVISVMSSTRRAVGQQEASTGNPSSGRSVSFLQYVFSWIPSWRPTSSSLLEQSEKEILKEVKSEFKESFVPIDSTNYLRTVTMEATETDPQDDSAADQSKNFPLVMVHGFGAGFLQFYKNLDFLHSRRRVVAFDLPGFARSSRVTFTSDAEAVEMEFVDYIEKWRENMGIAKFILLGHSLGGFLACAYAIKYPCRVRHLILVDPWGFPVKPATLPSTRPPLPWSIAASWMGRFNPLSPIRIAGPFGLEDPSESTTTASPRRLGAGKIGPRLVQHFRPDLVAIFGESFMNYVYHCNAQNPTGETAFMHMQVPMAWAKRPMLPRIGRELHSSVPISMIYGTRSWMDSTSGDKVLECRPSSYVNIYHVQRAGHHVHAHRPHVFNALVNDICSKVEARLDIEPVARVTSVGDGETDT